MGIRKVPSVLDSITALQAQKMHLSARCTFLFCFRYRFQHIYFSIPGFAVKEQKCANFVPILCYSIILTMSIDSIWNSLKIFHPIHHIKISSFNITAYARYIIICQTPAISIYNYHFFFAVSIASLPVICSTDNSIAHKDLHSRIISVFLSVLFPSG